MKRLRYNESHWSREEDVKKGLEQYLELNEKVFNKTMNRFFKEFIGDVNGKKVLDYGGGAGFLSVYCADKGANIVIVDAEESALNTAIYYAKKQKVQSKIQVIQSDTIPKNLKDDRFDIIIAKDVIEHIEDDQKFLFELSECQSKGGILLLSTQNKFSLNYILEGNYQKHRCKNMAWCGWDPTHLRFYTPWSLKAKLVKAGYKTEKWASIFIIPYNIFSWIFLLKLNIDIPALHYFDLLFGESFPFNRLGWNFIVKCYKTA